MMNHYERLGVNPNADFETLKKAYYRCVKTCHPDLFGNSAEKTEEFKEIVIAFDTLSDPGKRSIYDERFLSAGKTGQPENAGNEAEYEEPPLSPGTIMDTDADDTLEELIVGNAPPAGTTLATLLADLEKTVVFMTFREAKNMYSGNKFKAAEILFARAVAMSPHNIVYHVSYARCLTRCGKVSKALSHYMTAIRLGDKRIPPQQLIIPRREFEALSRAKSPFIHKIKRFFFPVDLKRTLPPDEEMIEQTNRAMQKILAQDKRDRRRKLNR